MSGMPIAARMCRTPHSSGHRAHGQVKAHRPTQCLAAKAPLGPVRVALCFGASSGQCSLGSIPGFYGHLQWTGTCNLCECTKQRHRQR